MATLGRAQNINPELLRWARESAGLGRDEAAKSLGLSDSGRSTAAEKLAAFERGEAFPTRAQLLKFAAVYRRPVVSFYLKRPPSIGARGDDFRGAGVVASTREDALLDTLIRNVRVRQEMLRDLLDSDEDYVPRAFVGSASMEDGAEAVARDIATALVFDARAHVRTKATRSNLFATLRKRTERMGVFVLLVGDLGSHHTDVPARVFRGFAIADRVAPLVVVNDNDAKVAWAFTLVHELAHIWLGNTGVSGPPIMQQPRTREQAIERFCNDVASEILLPARALDEDLPSAVEAHDDVRATITEVASKWSVSEPMVAYRVFRAGLIENAAYEELKSYYDKRWEERQSNAAHTAQGGGDPDFYVVRRHRLGGGVLSLVRRALAEGGLTPTRAAKVLGVKAGAVDRLLHNEPRSPQRRHPKG